MSARIRAPARPHGWVRLAYARTIGDGPSPEVAALLARSLEAGAFVGEITLARLELLLRTWDHLRPETRGSTGKQIRFAWEHDENGLIGVARRSGRVPIVRFALRTLPGALDQFDAGVLRSLD